MRSLALVHRDTPYHCQILWFHLQDGRLAALDVVRSDDLGQRSLRFFAFAADRIDYLVAEGATGHWTFRSDGKESGGLSQAPAVLEISRDRVAGRADLAGCPAHGHREAHGIANLAFRLDLQALARPLGLGRPGLLFAHMTALDYLTVRITGSMEINGKAQAVDALGSVSQHFGEHLVRSYGYLTNRFAMDSAPGAPRILEASFAGANFRLLGGLLEDRMASYAHTQHAGGLLLSLGWNRERLDRAGLRVGLGRGAAVQVRNLRMARHAFLGVATLTGIGDGRLERPGQPDLDLGKMLFDVRGEQW